MSSRVAGKLPDWLFGTLFALVLFVMSTLAHGDLAFHRATLDPEVYARTPSRFEAIEGVSPYASGRVYVEREAALLFPDNQIVTVTIEPVQQAAVQSARPGHTVRSQSYYVAAFDLTPEGRAQLNAFVQAHQREITFLRFDGVPLGLGGLWGGLPATHVRVELEERSLDKIRDAFKSMGHKVAWKSIDEDQTPSLTPVVLTLLICGLLAGLFFYLGRTSEVWPVFGAYAAAWFGILALGVAIRVGYDSGRISASTARGLTDFAVIAVLILIPLTLTHPLQWTRLRLSSGSETPGQFAVMILAALALRGAWASLSSFLSAEWPPGAGTPSSVAGSLWNIIVLGVLGGTAREIFFRGYMQTRLRERWRSSSAILVTSACYGIFHPGLLASPGAAAEGLFFGYLTERTGSIRPAIGAHVAANVLWRVYEDHVFPATVESYPDGLWSDAAWILIWSTLLAGCLVWLRRARTPSG